MTEYTVHRPTFSETTKGDWTFPTEQDFDTDELQRVAERFLVSESGFDEPESYDDLHLPVVNEQGYLSLNGLWVARTGPYSVERIPDIDDATKAEVKHLIDKLGTEHFEEFKDVTVTEAEWEAATTGTTNPPNPAGGVVESFVDSSTASYSSTGATIGLVFLVAATAVVGWVRDRR